MEPDTIKQIVDALESLSGDTKEVFIWYLIVARAPIMVCILLWTIGGLWIIWKVIKIIYTAACNESVARRLATSFGIQKWPYGEWNETLVAKACEILKEHKIR